MLLLEWSVISKTILAMYFVAITGIIINRQSLIIVLMSIELMLLSITLNYTVTSIYIDDLFGQIFGLFILAVAGAESSLGLAILVVYYRIRGTLSIYYLNTIKG